MKNYQLCCRIQIATFLQCLVSYLSFCDARELFQRKIIKVVAKMAIQIEARTEHSEVQTLSQRIHTSRLRSNKDIQSEVRRQSE